MIQESRKNNLDFQLLVDGGLRFRNQLCISMANEGLWNEVSEEAHISKLSVHSGSTKMWKDLQIHFLVEADEKGHCKHSLKVLNMSTSKYWTSKTIRNNAKDWTTNLEMREYHDGLRGGQAYQKVRKSMMLFEWSYNHMSYHTESIKIWRDGTTLY